MNILRTINQKHIINPIAGYNSMPTWLLCSGLDSRSQVAYEGTEFAAKVGAGSGD